MQPVLLIDGECNFCHGTVRFVVAHERDHELRFGALQSEAGRPLLAGTGIDPDDSRTVVLLDDDGLHVRSEAALRIATHLRAPWRWARVLRVVPRPLRDAAYDVVARNRFRWFGRRDACELPAPEIRARFLDSAPPA